MFFAFRDSYVLCFSVMNILCTFHISVSWVCYSVRFGSFATWNIHTVVFSPISVSCYYRSVHLQVACYHYYYYYYYYFSLKFFIPFNIVIWIVSIMIFSSSSPFFKLLRSLQVPRVRLVPSSPTCSTAFSDQTMIFILLLNGTSEWQVLFMVLFIYFY